MSEKDILQQAWCHELHFWIRNNQAVGDPVTGGSACLFVRDCVHWSICANLAYQEVVVYDWNQVSGHLHI